MARIIFPHDNVGEAKAYIKALTGISKVKIPSPPKPADLGQILKVESKFVSVSASANIGFGYGSVSGGGDIKVLLQDYWFLKEIQDNTTPEINSWTFAAGFRVGIKIVGYNASLNIGIGKLAAEAETKGLNVQVQILRVGMPKGPNVPVNLAVPVELNVEKFGELKVWEGNVLKYVEDKRNDLAPVVVSASINIKGDKLLNETPGVRYALWRISKGMSLKQALSLLDAGKAPEVGQGEVRSIYSTIFNDPAMVIPGHKSEKRKPSGGEKKAAKKWLTKYRNL